MHEYLPMPNRQRRLPDVLSLSEVQRLLDSASDLYHRAMLMTLYSTGMRRAEMCRLKVSDIDIERMAVQNHKDKLVDRPALLSRGSRFIRGPGSPVRRHSL